MEGLVSFLVSPIFSWAVACFLTSALAVFCIKRVQERHRRNQFREEACDDNRPAPHLSGPLEVPKCQIRRGA